ncbi:MAG: hypothetical protein RLZZ618_3345 [Pseudomonadota bacterium]|jgi:diguanylate cyclase (GGDEF)-like protein/PAS domain S-box-containing protein
MDKGDAREPIAPDTPAPAGHEPEGVAAAFALLLTQSDLLSNLHYWEQDASHRATRVVGPPGGLHGLNAVGLHRMLGHALWEMGGAPLDEPGGWDGLRARLDAQEPVIDLVVKYLSARGHVSFINHTMQPRLDANRQFIGHHGVFRDITRRMLMERQLVVEHQTARLMVGSTGARQAAAALLPVLSQTLGWMGGSFWHSVDRGRALSLMDSWWAPEATACGNDALNPPTLSLQGDDALQRACASGEVQWVSDLHTLPASPRQQQALQCGLRAAWAIPVRVDGRVVSVIELFGPAVEAADTRLMQSANDIAASLAELVRRERVDQERRQFRATVDAIPDMIYIANRDTMRYLYVNEAACVGANFSLEDHLRIGPHDLLGVPREQIESDYDSLIANPERGVTVETRARNKEGKWGYVELHRRAMRVGDSWQVLSVSRTINERKAAEAAALRASRMYAALSATNDAIIHAADEQSLFERLCDAAVGGGKFLTAAVLMLDESLNTARAAAASGSASDRILARTMFLAHGNTHGGGLVANAVRTGRSCVSQDVLTDERIQSWREQAREAEVASAGAFPLVVDGRTLGVLLLYSGDRQGFGADVITLVERMAENTAFALANLAHQAERRQTQERISYLASHDALTGLPNRVTFGELLHQAIATAQRYGRRFAVLFVDLDRFKIINDSLGHAAGDQLLKEVSQRLHAALRSSDVVARLGGDEFVMLVQEVEGPDQVEMVARKILAAAIRPVTLLGQECRVTASVGISMYPADAQDEEGLMKNADMAMYQAKEHGKNNYQFFSAEVHSQSLERMLLETQLRTALERQEFKVHYQPKIDVKTQAITGVEALLRWTNPQLGSVSPVRFISLAEETGLIVPIGRWVLRTACEQSAAWQRAGLPPVHMAVNISVRQFADDSLVDDVAYALSSSGIAPASLELEITENMVITNPTRALALLTRIKSMGVRLAIDDFGSGYSSLGQLKTFPVDTLKVDRSFIHDLARNADDRAITEAIISMGKSLSLNVVAEGVETIEQLDFLRASACDEMQGFYFSQAVSAEAFATLLRAQTASA